MTASTADGKVRWGLTLDVVVEGIELPFRLRIVTDSEETLLEALSDFQSMIIQKIQSLDT